MSLMLNFCKDNSILSKLSGQACSVFWKIDMCFMVGFHYKLFVYTRTDKLGLYRNIVKSHFSMCALLCCLSVIALRAYVHS